MSRPWFRDYRDDVSPAGRIMYLIQCAVKNVHDGTLWDEVCGESMCFDTCSEEDCHPTRLDKLQEDIRAAVDEVIEEVMQRGAD